jgi:hypothetical protein
MGATHSDNLTTLDLQSVAELEQQYAELKTRLTASQIEQVERGNMSMIRQFPTMGTAYAIYGALKRQKLRQRIAGEKRLL